MNHEAQEIQWHVLENSAFIYVDPSAYAFNPDGSWKWWNARPVADRWSTQRFIREGYCEPMYSQIDTGVYEYTVTPEGFRHFESMKKRKELESENVAKPRPRTLEVTSQNYETGADHNGYIEYCHRRANGERFYMQFKNSGSSQIREGAPLDDGHSLIIRAPENFGSWARSHPVPARQSDGSAMVYPANVNYHYRAHGDGNGLAANYSANSR
ncbi:hypothetical protein [Streptomyces sp. NPDC048489]|uniref:hypothetical protein n=1 Tax=Streptomyces sp. NPDC048489 TaxID=3154504 RepID=UPI00342B6EDC